MLQKQRFKHRNYSWERIAEEIICDLINTGKIRTKKEIEAAGIILKLIKKRGLKWNTNK